MPSARTVLGLDPAVSVRGGGGSHGVRSEPPAAAVNLEDMVADGGGVGERGASQWDGAGLGRERLPPPALRVPRELLRSFPHSKRVGSYLIGKMINKGSFAKVMQGLHIGTGEKVGAFSKTYKLGQERGRTEKVAHFRQVQPKMTQLVP